MGIINLNFKKMIRKILFIATFFVAGIVSAQTFQLQDDNNVSIVNSSHYEYGVADTLAETKFHVKNISGGSATYTARVFEIQNPTAANLQICFGSNCFTSQQTITGSVTLGAGQTDATFKVAPFTFAWGGADSAVWRVTVFDMSNPNDSSSAIITWKEGFPTTITEVIAKKDVNFSVYPNPASDNLTINYNIDANVSSASVDVFDVVGKRVLTHKLLGAKGVLKVGVSDLKSGIYFYTIKADGQTLKTERVIIK